LTRSGADGGAWLTSGGIFHTADKALAAPDARQEGDATWRTCNTPHEGGGIDMKHPANRAERRHHRQRIINHRRFIRVNGSAHPWPHQMWGQYSKWNGNCGSTLCHCMKYFGHKRKRRDKLKRAAQEAE
jgi:hypothetical protein